MPTTRYDASRRECPTGGHAHAGADPRPAGWRAFVAELLPRVFAASALSYFAYAALLQWRMHPARITLIVTVLAASLTVGLSLFARVPTRRDWSLASLVLSLGGTYYFLLFQLNVTERLAPDPVAASVQLAGLVWQIYAKLSLRGAFGILPAHRGIVSRGAYRFVRHPIYLGYLIVDVGFLVANFSVQNVAAIALQLLLQAGRIHREERILSDDAAYRTYRETVRHRVIPGVF
ncbi:Isoprenylcysteine carboxyl methyltransferase [Burkholderia multivorans]